jgi:glycosyltransferase involved in cell wall biosynthesis
LLAATHPSIKRIARALAGGDMPADFLSVARRIEEELGPILAEQDVVMVHNAFTLHFNTPLTEALVELAATRLAGRIVAWTHDIGAINELYRDEFHPGGPWDLFRRPQPGVRYVAISGARRDELLALWDETGSPAVPIDVVPNGIDPEKSLRLSPGIADLARRHLLLLRDDILLLPVRVTRRKRIELAVEVIDELRRRGRDAALLITGPVRGHHPGRSRSYLGDLQSMAATLQLGDHVLFLADTLGRSLRDREVSELYSLSTVVFLPSRSEGFGLPIVEAGLHRVPIVATDLPVFREIAGASSRFFSEDASRPAIADLVAEAAEESVLRARILREYSWPVIHSRYIGRLLDDVSRGRRF